jgi:hypothetical protein
MRVGGQCQTPAALELLPRTDLKSFAWLDIFLLTLNVIALTHFNELIIDDKM